MKKFLTASFSLLLLVNVTAAQEAVKTRTVEQYETVIKTAKNLSEKFLQQSFYDDMIFKNKETEEIKKFSSLTTFEKKVFILFRAERLKDNLEFISKEFEKDLNLASKKNERNEYLIPLKAKEKNDPAGKEDVEKFIKDIKDIRKNVAKDYEKYAENLFKENKDQFNEKEIKNYIEKMKKYHDEQGLIERKKE